MIHARSKTSQAEERIYKILNEQFAPNLREKFIKIKHLNREYNLRSYDHFQNLKETILI